MYIEKIMKTRLSINSENSKRFFSIIGVLLIINISYIIKLIYSTLDCKSLSGFELQLLTRDLDINMDINL